MRSGEGVALNEGVEATGLCGASAEGMMEPERCGQGPRVRVYRRRRAEGGAVWKGSAVSAAGGWECAEEGRDARGGLWHPGRGERQAGLGAGAGMSECRGGCCGGDPGGWVRWGGCVGWQVEDSAGGWVKSECEQRAHGNTGRWMTRSDLEEEGPSRCKGRDVQKAE